jgi:Xaa-Pro aminopeptidase
MNMQTNERLLSLQASMPENSIDLTAIGPTANMRYLLGFMPHPDERLCLLLVSREFVRIVVPGLNRDELAAHTDVDLIPWTDSEGPRNALKAALDGLDKEVVVAVDGAMRADQLLHLQAIITPKRIIPAENIISPLRACKSKDEIESLALAAGQADRAMQAAIDACKPGITEAEVAWEAEKAFRIDGAEEVCFTLVASGPNGAYPHHHSGNRRLQEGDAVIIDIGASLNGYKSDITRMVHLGKPSREFLRAYSAVFTANQKAAEGVQPGAAVGDIDNIARGILVEEGYGPNFIHRTGHGIGLETHEAPWIMAGEKTILEEGMVFSIEPGVYIEGQFGIRLEDIAVVTSSGVRILTDCDRSLVVKEL